MSSEELIEMPFLRNIGLVMTYKCQVSCPHCILEAGPHREEEISLEDAFEWIRQIALYRNGYIKVLSLTGGEPFYNIPNLEKISSYASSLNLLVSVVTNAFWASSPGKAVSTLKELPALKMIAISTDTYHQKFIPFENIRNAVHAAKKCGLPYNIAVCTENEKDSGYRQVIEQLSHITEPDTINTAVTFPAGRALKKVEITNYDTTDQPPVSACSAGSSPIIFPDGRVIACIGPVIDLKGNNPLVLGNLKNASIDDILDRAELNPVLHAIRIWGPGKLIAMIKDSGLESHLPKTFIKNSVCNACYSLMSNQKIADFLNNLSSDRDFCRRVAYARVYYLKETKMAQHYRAIHSSC